MYKLLVVDDEPKIRELIREYAEFSNYEVTEAGDGMEAVGLVKLNDYDLTVGTSYGIVVVDYGTAKIARHIFEVNL